DLAAGAGVKDLNLQSDSTSSFRQLSQRGLGARHVARIDQHGNATNPTCQLAQQTQPLARDLPDENVHAGRIAASPGKGLTPDPPSQELRRPRTGSGLPW